MHHNSRYFAALVVLIVSGLACSFGQPAGSKPSPTPQAPVPQGQATETPLTSPSINTAPTPTSIPSSPIGLRQGLSSLNSYRLIVRMINNGPTDLDKSDASFIVESGADGDTTHIKNVSTLSSEENSEVETSETDQYYVGTHQCIIPEDGEIEKSDVDPMLKEIADTWYGLIDLVPTVAEPEFINAEQINGVMTNHFKFKVGGLGVNSGAEVVASSGEYWLAQDGQYIVKYQVIMETRNGPSGDPQTKTVHSEFSIEVTDINQDIIIEVPANCQ